MLKKIFNLHEEATHQRLGEACRDYGAQAHPKIRMADILPIENSGISDAQYSYALKAHFDFVVCDCEHAPQFAVEFDGPSHRESAQKARDDIKNQLCDRFDLPLLRINSNHLTRKYREYDLLSWLVEAWFMEREFRHAQEEGHVSPEEDFDPLLVFNVPGREPRFPMWLSADLRIKVQRLHEKGTITGRVISHWIGVDEYENYHGISWIRVSDDIAVMAETSMRRQQFPMPASELLSEILSFESYSQLEQVLQQSMPGVRYSTVMERVKYFASKFDPVYFAGSGDENPREN